jgi:hypothetical protein
LGRFEDDEDEDKDAGWIEEQLTRVANPERAEANICLHNFRNRTVFSAFLFDPSFDFR